MLQRAMVLSILGVLLAAASGLAQPPGRWRGPGSFGRRGMTPDSLTFLTGIPEVQKELELSTEQQELLQALQADFRDQWFGLGRGGDSDEAREQLREKIRKSGDELVTTVLEEKQMQRLRQIRLQREGVRALVRTEIVQAIEISDAQLAQIREITDSDSRGEANRQGNNPSGREPRTDPENPEDQVLALLTDRQKAKWEELKGPEFAFPERRSRSGRRGFGGGERRSRPQRPE